MNTTRATLGRRDFVDLALAGIAGVSGMSLIGPTGARHDGGHQDGTPEASPSASPVAESGEVAIETFDLRFEPKELTIPAHSNTRIVVTNKGFLQHDVVIPELGLRTTRLNAGGMAELVIDAAPGTYAFHCSIVGHEQAGMKGVITVV